MFIHFPLHLLLLLHGVSLSLSLSPLLGWNDQCAPAGTHASCSAVFPRQTPAKVVWSPAENQCQLHAHQHQVRNRHVFSSTPTTCYRPRPLPCYRPCPLPSTNACHCRMYHCCVGQRSGDRVSMGVRCSFQDCSLLGQSSTKAVKQDDSQLLPSGMLFWFH